MNMTKITTIFTHLPIVKAILGILHVIAYIKQPMTMAYSN
jgi:hypothetical protein